VQYSTVLCSTVQYSAVHAVQYSAVLCSAVLCCAVHAVQYSAVLCSTVHYSTVLCSAVQYCAVQCCAVQCSVLSLNTHQHPSSPFLRIISCPLCELNTILTVTLEVSEMF
jgi:hypothetical protein